MNAKKRLSYKIGDHPQAGEALRKAEEAFKVVQSKFASAQSLEDEIANRFNPFAVHSED